jgi:chromosome partitioning protein
VSGDREIGGIIIALIARKGGVGKTTIAGNLACEIAARGYEVQLLDADPQGSLLAWAGLGPGFLSDRVHALRETSIELFRKKVELALPKRGILILDTPPGFADHAVMSALVADLVLIPCGASPLDLMAARDTVTVCVEAAKQRGGGKPVVCMAGSRFQPNTGLAKELAASLRRLAGNVLPGISQRVALTEAAMGGLTIREFAPGSKAHLEFQVLASGVMGILQ